MSDKNRILLVDDDPEIIESMTDHKEPPGILIAYWDRKELEADGLPMPEHITN